MYNYLQTYDYFFYRFFGIKLLIEVLGVELNR